MMKYQAIACLMLAFIMSHLDVIRGYTRENESCYTFKVDTRNNVGSMNSAPGTAMNIFPTLMVNQTVRIEEIKYHAIRAGRVFVSFWKQQSGNSYVMLSKLLITSTKEGRQSHRPDDLVLIPQGASLGIHYADHSSMGVIDLESDNSNDQRTSGVSVYEVFNPDYRDDGWIAGETSLNFNTPASFMRSAALHIEMCVCHDGYHGEHCNQSCSGNCLNGEICNKDTGECDTGCRERYYGPRCRSECSGNCKNNVSCLGESGACPNGCTPGFDYSAHRSCDIACQDQSFGENCMGTCSGNCRGDEVCNKTNGYCSEGCKFGFNYTLSRLCDIEYDKQQQLPKSQNESNDSGLVAGLVIILIIAVAAGAFIAFLFYKRLRRRTSADKYTEDLPTVRVPDKDFTRKGQELEDHDHFGSDKRRPIDVSKFHNTMMQMDPEQLAKEFSRLPKGKTKPWTIAAADDLAPKNKFKNILPYDKNRVVLQELDGDPTTKYINASTIHGHIKGDIKKFIASQGPENTTVNDFWRMLWEYNIHVIVMLTNLVEKMKIKCEQYWPNDGYATFGDIHISLIKEEVKTDVVIRQLKATKGKTSRLLYQIHYEGWPDYDVPLSTSVTMDVLDYAREFNRKSQESFVVVHCSAGVGRTGTFIALDFLTEQVKHSQDVDVFWCVNHLRSQRVDMVQTLDQYRFIYRTMDEYLELGYSHVIHKNNCPRELTKLLYTEEGIFKLSKQFQFLEDIKPKPKLDDVAALSNTNKDKNRHLEIVPTDDHRIKLEMDGVQSDYINAIIVQAPGRKLEYCVTQIPLAHTSGDFWQLMSENYIRHIVVFNQQGHSNEHWLPKENNLLEFGAYSVRVNKTEEIGRCMVMDVQLHRLSDYESLDGGDLYMNVSMENQEQTEYANTQEMDVNKIDVKVFACTMSTQNDSLEALECIMELQKIIGLHIRTGQQMALLCMDGASESGLFLACDTLAYMLPKNPTIDILSIVQNIRRKRPQFIVNLDEFKFLYEYVKKKLQSTK